MSVVRDGSILQGTEEYCKRKINGVRNGCLLSEKDVI